MGNRGNYKKLEGSYQEYVMYCQMIGYLERPCDAMKQSAIAHIGKDLGPFIKKTQTNITLK
jgi:hypothetical protein